jgi:hypothetical protein
MARFHVGTFAAKIKFGSQEAKVDGEIGCLHLMVEIPSYGILSMWTAADADREQLRIGRLKKGKTNQMVPVSMSEEQTHLSNIFSLRQGPAEIAQSRTGIDNNDLSSVSPDLKACGVSAIAQGRRSRSRN